MHYASKYFRRYKNVFTGLCLLALFLSNPATHLAAPGKPKSDATSAGRSPSLLFVTIDTWRWDYIGASKSGKVKTPALDKLASDGVYIPEIITPYPLTTPAHASMFTGLNPLNHRVLDCASYSLSPSIPTLAQAFKENGYRTGAFVSGDTLKKRYGLDRGFGVYDDSDLERRGVDDSMPFSRDGARTTAAALSFLKAAPANSRIFCWVHLFDLHIPYRPRPDFDKLYPNDRYAAAAAFEDTQVGALVSFIRADTSREWRIVVVGDHGEGLGDHHEVGHGMAIYRSTLSVPLLIYPKPSKRLQLPQPWSLVDLDPTLREWFSLPPSPKADGASLFSPGQLRDLPAMTLLPSLMFGVNPVLGVRRGGLMYMKHGEEELFDQAADPAQKRDLSKSKDMVGTISDLRKAVASLFPALTLQSALSPTLKATPKDLDNLKGLGYVSGGVPKMSELQRAAIWDVLDDYNSMETARSRAYRTKDLASLRKNLEAFLAKYPNSGPIYKTYGKLLLQMQDFEAAFKAYDRAARLDPDDADTLLNLGTLQLKRGNVQASKVLLLGALKLNDSDPVIRLNLGILYSDYLKSPKEALLHYRRFLELDPNSAQSGRVREIVSRLEKMSGK